MSSLPCAMLLLALNTLLIHPNQSSFLVVLLQDANNKINKMYSWFSLCFCVPSIILSHLSSQSHHWLNGHEFEQALGDGEGQGSLAYCSPWGHRVGHDWMTEHQQHNLSLFFQWVTEIRRLAKITSPDLSDPSAYVLSQNTVAASKCLYQTLSPVISTSSLLRLLICLLFCFLIKPGTVSLIFKFSSWNQTWHWFFSYFLNFHSIISFHFLFFLFH